MWCSRRAETASALDKATKNRGHRLLLFNEPLSMALLNFDMAAALFHTVRLKTLRTAFGLWDLRILNIVVKRFWGKRHQNLTLSPRPRVRLVLEKLRGCAGWRLREIARTPLCTQILRRWIAIRFGKIKKERPRQVTFAAR